MGIGIDLGGTNIKGGIVDEQGKILRELSVKTDSARGYADVKNDLLTLIKELLLHAPEEKAIGIGIPGMPETDDGTLYAANVPAASGKPLRADLSALLERDVRLDNDANCFALSEPYLSIVPIAVSPSMFALSRFKSLPDEGAFVSSSKIFMSPLFISRTRVLEARYRIYFLAAALS